MRVVLLLVVGAAVGLAASAVQVFTLAFGALAADQLAALGATLAAAGAGAALLGAALAGRLRTGGPRAAGAAGAIGAAVVLGAAVPLNRKPRPPVLLVVTDTTRADHLSLHGYGRRTTPFLEELAEGSIVFEDAVSQGSHTIVTVPSLLASCYPSEHGLDDYRDVLADDHVLLPEVLAEAGYYTIAVVTNPHLSPRNGFAQGWAHYELHGLGNTAPVAAADVNERLLRKLELHRPVWEAGDPARRTDAPVFAFLFYTDPHSPYWPPGDWPRLWRGDGPDAPRPEYRWDDGMREDPERLASLVASYDAAIAYWDDRFRDLAARLAERGLWDDALLVYTSDHGEEFLDHGGYGHGHSVYEEVVRVPLLVSLPVPVRFPPLPRTARRVGGAVASVDVLPTVLEYLRLPVPPGASGQSVLDVALGRAAPDPDRPVFLEQALEEYPEDRFAAVRTSREKLVRRFARGDVPLAQESLFDLEEDPGERVDLVLERAGDAERLGALLDAHRAARDARAAEPGRTELDAAHRERLRALGYVE